ncbi:MAG: HlyD family efflux transporter periplasmic adaptor subunit [Lachnospiraceae bacterium]|nr:HlyD family efflux transporter periplasmic adaptor subunit [Lachnospiraceae bacterium]
MKSLKKREIIKNIAIVFLVIMLILTFFSNTIMNRTLPEVSTQTVTSGPVTTQVRGEGTVEAEDPYNLVIDETRKVKSVPVRVGDHVEEGDIIYYLLGETSEELTTAKNELESLKGEYELTILESGLTQAEVASVEAGVKNATGSILSTLEAKDSEINSLKAQLEEKEKKHSELEHQISISEPSNSSTTVDYSAEEKAVENAQTALDSAKSILNSLNEAKSQAVQIAQAKTEALANYNAEKDNFYGTDSKKGVKTIFDEAEVDYENKKTDYTNKFNDHQTKTADYNSAKTAYNTAENEHNADPSDKTKEQAWIDAQAAMNNAETAMNAAKEAMDNALSAKDAAETNYNTCKKNKEDAEAALNTAKTAMEETNALSANAPTDEQIANAQADVNAKQAALNQANTNLTNKKNSANSSSNQSNQNYQNLKNQEYEMSVAINDLKSKIEKLEADRADYLSTEKTKMGLETKYQEILKKEKQIKDLEAKALGGEIKSPVTGEITSLAYSGGEKIEAGETAAVIQIDGKGYKLSFPVNAKQAKAVKVGDPVSVENSWYYGDLNVNLVAIQPDKSNSRDGKILVFSLSGESVYPGQNLTLSVGEKSSNYDLIVPNAALHEDNNGHFVLIVDTKSTPFGSRYIAKRVDVTVLAQDDKVAAVDAELFGYEYVITNSSKYIENKDQVKLAD